MRILPRETRDAAQNANGRHNLYSQPSYVTTMRSDGNECVPVRSLLSGSGRLRLGRARRMENYTAIHGADGAVFLELRFSRPSESSAQPSTTRTNSNGWTV
jgi:hypothetical protein